MALREASIRLSLRAGSFLGGLRALTDEVGRVGQKMSKAMSAPLKAGFQAARQEAGAIFGELKGGLKAAATLGGAIGGGAMLKGAVDLQSAYTRISFQIQNATGKLVSLDRIQRAVSDGALKTSRTHQELASALAIMMDRGASADFALGSLESVGNVMNATGMDAERTGRMMAALSKMYGMSGEEGKAALDGVMLAASRSGSSVEEMFEDFTEFGSIANAAGLRGKAGFATMMGMLATVGPKLNGTTSEMSSGMDVLFERLRDVGVVTSAMKEGGGKFDAAEFIKLDNAVDQANYLMKAGPEVMQKFKESFVGREETAAFDAFLGPYFQTLNEGLKSGKSKVEANAAAMAAAQLHISDMGKPFGDAGRVVAASAREQETAAAKLRAAQGKMLEAFTDAKTMEAIDSFAKHLPKLAEGMAKLVAFTVENPALAGGLYVGGRMGGAAAGSALQNVTHSVSKKAFEGLGEMIARDAAKSGGWATAGKAIGVAAAALLAYELGKKLIDDQLDKDQSVLSKLNVATERAEALAGDPTASAAEKRKALEELNAARAEHLKTPMSASTAVFGKAAAFITGDESLNPEAVSMKASKEAAQMTRVLEGQLGSTSDEAKRAADTFKQLATEARAAASALKNVKPGGTPTNGPPAAPGNQPGHG